MYYSSANVEDSVESNQGEQTAPLTVVEKINKSINNFKNGFETFVGEKPICFWIASYRSKNTDKAELDRSSYSNLSVLAGDVKKYMKSIYRDDIRKYNHIGGLMFIIDSKYIFLCVVPNVDSYDKSKHVSNMSYVSKKSGKGKGGSGTHSERVSFDQFYAFMGTKPIEPVSAIEIFYEGTSDAPCPGCVVMIDNEMKALRVKYPGCDVSFN